MYFHISNRNILHLQSKSVAGALTAAKFCKNAGDYSRAIEFLILSRRFLKAFSLESLHKNMN